MNSEEALSKGILPSLPSHVSHHETPRLCPNTKFMSNISFASVVWTMKTHMAISPGHKCLAGLKAATLKPRASTCTAMQKFAWKTSKPWRWNY